ncbi:AMP-dependent synthetase/ligase domain [Bartonella choladocola]|uniref:AMP-binding protein n=1 Tax=Bartonella TaxID=773 RepID=UPI0018DEBC2B|nr:AMP-binding protein [Bartonella choladocola]MBI0139745.1 AMP-binding protein [Bartonella choladocola]
MPVIDVLAKHASLTPDRIAISIAGNKITYKTLYQRAEAFRRNLFKFKKRHPDHFGLPDEGRLVLLALPNHFRFGEIFVGGSASPHCVAVLSVATPPNQIEEIMRRLNPDIVICENKDCIIAEIARTLDLPALYVEKDTDTQLTYDRFLATYDRFLATYDRFLEGTNPDKTIADLPLGPFFIGFTSGTTGLPKAFIRNRQSWRNSLVTGRKFFGLDKLHKAVAPGPMAHGVSLYALIETLDSGQTFESVRKFNVDEVLELLKTADRFVGVPTMLNELRQRADEHKSVFKEMKQLVTGASKFDRQHYNDARALFPNAEILQYYGASELSFVAVNKMTPRTLSHETSMSPVGKPFPGVKVTIRDENLLPLAPDKIGTIFVESDLISDGYLWGDNGKSFVRNQYGATVGDLGMMDKNGELYVMGRAGGMIISGGNNIYLAEIETALKTIPNVSEAIAFGIADDVYGERLVSVVSFKDAPLTADELREFCRPLMEKFKIPKDFYLINHWPMTWSGKIARVIVKRMVEEGAPEVTRL